MNYSRLFCILLLTALILPLVITETDDEIQTFGFDLEEVFSLGSGILALALFAVTTLAYRQSKRKRLAFVCLAFLLFAVKGVLGSLELFGLEIASLEVLAAFLDFGILLSFFIGILRK
jgi:hypothetical protein